MNRNLKRSFSDAFLRVCTKRLGFIGILAALTLVWACYSVSRTSYSTPQDSASQWLIEFRTGEDTVQMTLRYSSARNESSWGAHSHSFQIPPEQLQGLTREQAMSSGTHVQFQLKRDAGTFNCDGWFKEGNGSGHFTFAPSAAFVSELKMQGYGEPTYEQQFSMAMCDVSLAFINELQDQGY